MKTIFFAISLFLIICSAIRVGKKLESSLLGVVYHYSKIEDCDGHEGRPIVDGRLISEIMDVKSELGQSEIGCDLAEAGISPSCFLGVRHKGESIKITESKARLSTEENIVVVAAHSCISDVMALIIANESQDSFINLLLSVFNKNKGTNLTVRTAPLAASFDGVSTFQLAGSKASGLFFFSADLTLNEKYTSTATKDWLLATIIHEMIHCYIGYYRERRNAGYISELEFNAKFPLYSNSTSINKRDHMEMAGNYVTTIANILRDYNPALTEREAEALAWSGLQDTKAWKELDDTTLIFGINQIGQGQIVMPSSCNQNPC